MRDLLEALVEPSKVISDQYAAVVFTTTDGKVVTGRIVNIHGDTWHVNTDMLNPSAQVKPESNARTLPVRGSGAVASGCWMQTKNVSAPSARNAV